MIGISKKKIQKALKQSQGKDPASRKIKKKRKIDAEVRWEGNNGKKGLKLYNA